MHEDDRPALTIAEAKARAKEARNNLEKAEALVLQADRDLARAWESQKAAENPAVTINITGDARQIAEALRHHMHRLDRLTAY